MKIYIIIDEYYNCEQHNDFADLFTDPDEALSYIWENQSDGHKLKCIIKEV